MKINWGTGLAIGMTLFIGFIMYFVVKMNVDTRYDHDLVTEEYYRKEMVYQQEIDAETNAQNLSARVSGKRVATGWELTFPAELSNSDSDLSGTILLYRPSSEKLDFEMPLLLQEGKFLIPDKNLVPGRWNIIVSWDYSGKPYMYKSEILY